MGITIETNEDIYAQLRSLGVNVEAIKQMGLSDEQLSELLIRLTQLMKKAKRQ
jgi:post-segregation antitoxin (ccd killing protein)